MKSSNKNNNNSEELLCGIDEAGRGPVIGPMVICGVCFTKLNVSYLKKIGVRDSKKLSQKRRSELATLIKEKCHSYEAIVISAKEIDERERNRITLNRLEELKIARILNKLKPDTIYLDAADVNEQRFGKSVKKLLVYEPKEIISKHKADDIYPIVSAGAIVAKDKRDTLIEELKKKYGDLGSGYPSDKKTTDFIREWVKKHNQAPPFARKTWETTKKILNEELSNKKITDYFN
ncbi:MAG: ribonuclease HII [Promethearchaeota archaeon]